MKAIMNALRFPALDGRRKARVVLLVLALVFAPVFISAPAAQAGTYDDLTGSTGQECRPQTLGNAAGSGFPGLTDPAPLPITPISNSPAAAEAAKTLQDGANNRIYHVYGWAGYNWEVCATGGPIKGAEALGNTNAWNDSEIGSSMLKMATGIAALNTGVAKMAASPGEVMKPLDEMIGNLSAMLKTALVDLWLPIVLMAAAALIAVNAMNGNARKAMTSIGAILVALFGLAYLSFAPIQAAQTMDKVAATAQTSVLQKAIEFAGKKDVPADETWGVIYTEEVIFPLWAEGITNWKQDDPRLKPHLAEERLGENIKSDQKFEKFTPTQAYQIRAYPWGATKTEQTDSDRRDAWNTIGEASQTPDAPTRAFTGQESNRTGTGFMALASVASSASFNIPANMMIFVSQIAFRLLPIVGLVLVLFLAFEPTRPLAYQMGRFFLASMINGVILGVFAAVHLAIVGALFNSSLGFLWATLATGIVSLIFFKVTKPVRSLTNTVVSFGKALRGGYKSLRGNSGSGSQQSESSNPNRETPGWDKNRPKPVDGDLRVPAPLKRQPAIEPPRKLIDTTDPKVGVMNGALKNAQGAAAKTATAPGKTGASAASSAPGKTGVVVPSTAHATTPAQRSYKTLQEAQRTDATRSRQVRVFIPPNAQTAPATPPRVEAQKGDRPAQRKFTPPVPQSNPSSEQKQPVAPLKSRS
jgi:hypothetical protein